MQALGEQDDHGTPAACEVGLTTAENLVFAILRGWAKARKEGVPPRERISAALAEHISPRTAGLFMAWAEAVEQVSRRPLRLTCPGCGGVATDAQRLIVSCGVAPADPGIAEALLDPILHDATLVVMLGRSLNASLAADGWRLPVRLGEATQHPLPQPVTRH